MNPHDRSQLNYIMSLDDQQFELWATSIPTDDVQYAIELIQAARLELAEQERELMEAELEDSTFAEANTVLSKFRL